MKEKGTALPAGITGHFPVWGRIQPLPVFLGQLDDATNVERV